MLCGTTYGIGTHARSLGRFASGALEANAQRAALFDDSVGKAAAGSLTVLDADLLARLEEAWALQGASVVDQLAPGLTDEEMDEVTLPLGLRLPIEARVWWGTHDGVPKRPDGSLGPERAIGPGLQYLPLREAAEAYIEDRRIFGALEGDPEPFRPATLLPITRSTGPILCDCSLPEGAPSPIYYTHTFGSPDTDLKHPVARSFGEMVCWWVDALTDGSWWWDAARRTWMVDTAKIDPKREVSGLV
jgi:cell wall assembly regulator SMI1